MSATDPLQPAREEALRLAAWLREEVALCEKSLSLGVHRRLDHDKAALGFTRAAEEIERLAGEYQRSQTRACGAEVCAARDVLAERRRQVEQEGWTFDRDDKYREGQLAMAASSYAIAAAWDESARARSKPSFWPWSAEWWKPTSRRRDLVKAGALILAEIERLDRAASPPPPVSAAPSTGQNEDDFPRSQEEWKFLLNERDEFIAREGLWGKFTDSLDAPSTGSAPVGERVGAQLFREMVTDAPVTHDYLSTACFHGLHDRCRKQCKFCDTPCRCECHASEKVCPTCGGRGVAYEHALNNDEGLCRRCSGTGRVPAEEGR